jgi:hypothetical protein
MGSFFSFLAELEELDKNKKSAEKKVGDAAKKVGSLISEGAKKTKSGATSAGKKVGSFFSDAANKTKSGATSAGKKVSDAARNAADKIKSVFSRSGFYNYSSEPAWMQKIDNSSLCNWFYAIYILQVIMLFTVVFGIAYAAVNMPKVLTNSNMFFVLIHSLVITANTLFLYLICDRSLS